jgi:hypothetical protein
MKEAHDAMKKELIDIKQENADISKKLSTQNRVAGAIGEAERMRRATK